MKILRLLTVLVIAALTFAACDDTTEGIGGSITNKIDNINISDSAFNVTTKSIVADSVLSRNNTGLIGNMKDPETGNYVKGDYMTQLSVLPTFSVDTLVYIKKANNGKLEAQLRTEIVNRQTNIKRRKTDKKSITKKLCRLFSILRKLEPEGNYVTVSELAKEFSVSEKTIMRDIQFLRFDGCEDIRYDPQKKGFYLDNSFISDIGVRQY